MTELFDPFAAPFWVRVGTAILCGGIVGVERQVRGKAMGARTSILICLSTTIFVTSGVGLDGGDPARIVGQVVTGVGFLGAGVIVARGGVLTGVTTASVIWTLAAIGSVIGFGGHLAAIALALLTVTVLTGIDLLESRFFGVGEDRDEAESDRSS